MKSESNSPYLSLTPTEMVDALHTPWQKTGEGYLSRTLRSNAVISLVPFRFVPLRITEAAERILDNPMRVCEYIVSAFQLYRETSRVEKFLGIPHVFNDGVLEWPDLIYFSWSDIDQVFAGRNLLYQEPKNLEVHAKLEDIEQVTEYDIKTGERKIGLRKPNYLDKMKTEIKYLVPDLESIALLAENQWQSMSLREYVNPLQEIGDVLRIGRMESAIEDMENLLENLKQTKNVPAIHLNGGAKKVGEERVEFKTWLHWK